MRVTLLLFFISISAFSRTGPQIEVVPNPKTIEDFDHQFKGCLENSECDQVMGLQLTRWRDLVSKLSGDKIENSKKMQFVELFRGKYGIPVEFYTTQKSQLGFKPLLFNSHCREHNPKDRAKTLRGMSFVKSISSTKATIWRDQAQIEIPIGELLTPQPVVVYGTTTETYQLPIGDQPLFIKNKSLYILREDDGFFYTLRISPDGQWGVESLDYSKLSAYEDKRSETSCPKEINTPTSEAFKVQFCKLIWDEDSQKTVVVKLFQGCAT